MAPRSRNAVLTYGLLTLNVKLSSAKDKPIEMKNCCVGQPGHDKHEATPITQPKHCPTCGPITAYDELVKGIPNGDGYTTQTQEDVAEAKAEFTQQYKKSLNFVPHPTLEVMAQTGPGESLNYIQPADVGGADTYAMLLRLVTERPDVTLATLHTPVSATNLFILTVRNGVLALEQRTRTENLRDVEFEVTGSVNEALYPMLVASTDAMLTPYVPEDYEDGYQKHLASLAEEQATVTPITSATSVVDAVEDMKAKLQAMMQGAA